MHIHPQLVSPIENIILLLCMFDLRSTSEDLDGGGGRTLKYLQSNSLVSSSFNSLTEKRSQ